MAIHHMFQTLVPSGAKRSLLLWLAPLLASPCISLAQTSIPSTPQMNLPRVQLQAGLYRIHAQVASTPQEQEVGLMFRQDMPESEGMLFVFQQAKPYCFWMKNTELDLSAAFIDDQGRIVNMVEMQAQTTQSHCAQAPVRYVLEMNKGWFAKRHMGAGFALKGPMW